MNSRIAKITVLISAVASLCSCSFAPILAQKAGWGSEKDSDLPQLTATVFSTDVSKVVIDPQTIKRDNTMNGTFIYYSALVNGKPFNCGMVSSFANGGALPKCVHKGEALNLQQATK